MEAEYIDTGKAPELWTDALHEVVLVGATCRFTMIGFRQSAGGVWFKEPVFFARMPVEAVAPALALTILKTGVTIADPATIGAVRDLVRGWLH